MSILVPLSFNTLDNQSFLRLIDRGALNSNQTRLTQNEHEKGVYKAEGNCSQNSAEDAPSQAKSLH